MQRYRLLATAPPTLLLGRDHGRNFATPLSSAGGLKLACATPITQGEHQQRVAQLLYLRLEFANLTVRVGEKLPQETCFFRAVQVEYVHSAPVPGSVMQGRAAANPIRRQGLV